MPNLRGWNCGSGGGGGDQPNFVFTSDYRTALGTTEAAIRDTDQPVEWSASDTEWGGGAAEGLEVITNPGTLGFPAAMTRILRVTIKQSGSGFEPAYTGGNVAQLGQGQSYWYRWYDSVVLADNQVVNDNEQHPHQDGGSIGSSNWAFHVYPDGGGANQWMPNINVGNQFDGPFLDKNKCYRFELKVTRHASNNTFTLDIRVFDEAISATVPLYDSSNFLEGATPLNGMSFPDDTPASFGQQFAGVNGVGDGGAQPWNPSAIYMYQGGFAISNQDWCGPYQAGEIAA